MADGAPGEVGQDAPRHARTRRTPRAAALERDAAQRSRAARPARQPARPQTFSEQRTAARSAARTRARATLAKRAAGVTPEGAAVAAADVGTRAAKDARTVRFPTGDRQYQGVILAEFLVAALIVGVAPLARGKGAQDTSGGPSPYGVDDIKQLAGIGAVYFILALLSSGKHGRFAAWFGGLILVAIGLSQTTSGGLPAIFGIFQPASQSAGASPNYGAGLGQYEPVPTDPFATPVPNATGLFPTIPPTGQVTPAASGQPTFSEQLVTPNGTTTQVYQGGPGVVTTNTGTQLA